LIKTHEIKSAKFRAKSVLAAQSAQFSEEIMTGGLVATLSQNRLDNAASNGIRVVRAGRKYLLNSIKASLLFGGVFLFVLFEWVLQTRKRGNWPRKGGNVNLVYPPAKCSSKLGDGTQKAQHAHFERVAERQPRVRP
jgi:hypothetical protein